MSLVRDERGALHELSTEHRVLMRRLGALQQRLDVLLRGHARQVTALEADQMRLRAQVVVLQTAAFWGIGAVQIPTRPAGRVRTQPPLAPESRQAQAVICQTGCASHAHPWLADDGLCQRSGKACERLRRDEMA